MVIKFKMVKVPKVKDGTDRNLNQNLSVLASSF